MKRNAINAELAHFRAQVRNYTTFWVLYIVILSEQLSKQLRKWARKSHFLGARPALDQWLAMQQERSVSASTHAFCRASDISLSLIIFARFGLTFATGDDMHGHSFAC